MYTFPLSIPNSLVSASVSVTCRVNASRLTPLANTLPNNPMAPSSAPCLLHRCCNRTRLRSYGIGRGLRGAEVGRWYGFDSCLLLVPLLQLGPICWLKGIGSPLAPVMFTFEPLGPPEFGFSPEAVGLVCGGRWEDDALARETTSAGVAYVGELYSCCG